MGIYWRAFICNLYFSHIFISYYFSADDKSCKYAYKLNCGVSITLYTPVNGTSEG